MPRPNRSTEKPKNFKSAVKKLFTSLGGFRKLILVALILAAFSSILTIFTPNILSDLTDTISDGLVMDTDNFQELTEVVTSSLNEENISKVINVNLSEESISEIMLNPDISDEDKNTFYSILNNIDGANMQEIVADIPEDVLRELLLPIGDISVDDQVEFITSMNTQLVIPDSIALELFSTVTIDETEIDALSQARFLEIVSTMDDDMSSTEMYALIDEMPDSIKEVVEPFMDIDTIKNIVIFLVCVYLISAVCSYFETIIMTSVSNNYARKLRSSISLKINKLPLKFFDKHSVGDILSRVTNDVDTIAQSMNSSLSTLVSAITLLVGTIIMMFVTNAVMAITAILASLFGFVFMFVVLGKSQKYFVAKQKELGNLDGHIEEIYSGLNVVKTYNGKASANSKFDELNNSLYKATWKSGFLSGLMTPMMSFIGNFGYVAVCIVGALLAMNGNISFGVIVAFITYVRLFTSPLSQIAQSMTNLQSTAASSERVFEFLEEVEMEDESHITKKLDVDKVKGNIEFKNIIFTYDGNDLPTINNFSVKVKPGQKVAIVGPTGAGKTTMVNLLMKFYDITDGDILIDGISSKELTRENIHDLFTMVLQDTWLFNGTVRENIVYNHEEVSDYDIREICKTVGLDHFIKSLPNGYDTILGDNDTVSAGQKQLLTIARGMVQETPFLILDEATSNVDTRTEELVQKAMDIITEGKTSFIIAHRLSTIKNADVILVMKDGNIIETGNHEELMKLNGFYAELYNSQFEL